MSIDLDFDVDDWGDDQGTAHALSALDSVHMTELLDESWDDYDAWDDGVIEAIGSVEVDHG